MTAALPDCWALCRESLGEPIYPSRLALVSPPEHHSPLHDELFRVDIEWGAEANRIDLPADILEATLPGALPAIADASDRIAADYISDFELGTTATQVRQLIVRLLPSGRANQERIAAKLYRSASTLQRQLNAEGTSFRDLLQATRQGLAEQVFEGRSTQPGGNRLYGRLFPTRVTSPGRSNAGRGKSPGEYRSAA